MAHTSGVILVGMREGYSDARFNAALGRHGHVSLGLLHQSLKVHKVQVPPGKEQAAVVLLLNDPEVEFAELDQVAPPTLTLNDPKITDAWHLAKIGAPAAWDDATGAGIVVAVVDGGVQSTHPDLAANIVAGWNVWDNNSTTTDISGHGTAVAGVIAAAGNNSIGSAGVAYGAHIMPIRATDSAGNGTFSSAANAILKAAELGADIVNISWANLFKSSTVIAAAQSFRNNYGGIVVVSANNNGIDEATASVPILVVVSGTIVNDTYWPTSSFGAMVDISAPCVNIQTTLINSTYNAPGSGAQGTSFATPIVAGVIALIMEARPDFTPDQVLDCLYSNALDLGGAGYDIHYGYGRVRADTAVAAALAAQAADTTPPTVTITSPAAAATVSGIVGVRVTAEDIVGVVRVDLKVAGTVVDSASATPFIFPWDTTASPNGSIALTATAYDRAGNQATSSAVNVTVSNVAPADTLPPSLAIQQPANNARVSGNVRIQTTATDISGNSTIVQVLYIDGVQKSTVTGPSLIYAWNTKKVPKGAHSIRVTATDSANNTSTVTITVTV